MQSIFFVNFLTAPLIAGSNFIIFTFKKRKNHRLTRSKMDSEFQEQHLSNYSSPDLVRYILASPRLSAPPCNVFLLSRTLIAKRLMADEAPDELKAMDIARQLGIRVPDIKRTIKAELSVSIIMQRVLGSTLN